MSELHKLHVESIDENGDATFHITHCPKSQACEVWHTCEVEGCHPTHEDAEVDGEVLHGLLHREIDYSWMSRDEPHNCAANFIDDWEGLDEVGGYLFDVDYLGDGHWVAVAIERVTK